MEARIRQTPWVWRLLLGAVLLVAALLRLWNLGGRGFLYWDEAKFSLEGLRFYGFIFHTADLGKTVGTAKPSHALLMALFYWLVGVRDLAPLSLNAVCSILSAGVLYLIGVRLYSRQTAILAALFLAVSEYDVLYARSALSESDACLFFLVASLVWIRAMPKSSLASRTVPGVLGGIAFTINYRMIVYLFALVAIDVLRAARESGIRKGVTFGLGWILGLVAAPLGWEVVDLTTRSRGTLLFRNEFTGAPNLYLQQVYYQLHQGKQSHLNFRPLLYPQWYLARQGVVEGLLLLSGLIVAAVHRTLASLLCLGLILFPYLAFTFAPFAVPRNLMAALPFAALLVAEGLLTIARWVPVAWLRALLLGGLTVLVVALGLMRSSVVTTERSGFTRAAEFVESRGATRLLSTSEILRFYFPTYGRCAVVQVPNSLSELKADVNAGYRYAVLVHPQSYAGQPGVKAIRGLAPVAQFPLLGARLPDENPIDSENGFPPNAHSLTKIVDVYQLNVKGLPAPAASHPSRCYPNQVL